MVFISLVSSDRSSVVYQTTSNFGDAGNPHLEELLGYLKEKGLIDSLVCRQCFAVLTNKQVFFQPRMFSDEEREDLITDTNPVELGGPKAGVANQFLNEGTLAQSLCSDVLVTKRELGRLDCLKNRCTHFLCLDADEYYIESELQRAKKVYPRPETRTKLCQLILENGWESSACRMRIYGKHPTIEYLIDDLNAVPFIHVS